MIYDRRQREPEATALSQAALRPDTPPLQLHVVLGDRESYTAAFSTLR